MRVFVSGMPGCGKTTLIKKFIDYYKNKKIVGFITEEIRKNNKRTGFLVKGIATNKKGVLASKEIVTNKKFGSYFLNIRSFEDVLQAENLFLSKAEIIVIDEIGKMEFESEFFKKFLAKCLEMNKPLLASLHRSYVKRFEKLGKIFWLTKENFEQIYEKVITIFSFF
jgi:nucleoside-triphosphatase